MKIKFCLSNSWGFHSLCLSWSLISLLAVSVEQKLLLAPRSETRGVKWSREPAACFILYFGSREETEWCDTRSHLLFSYWLSDLEAELCLLSLTKQGWVYFWQHISCDIINVWSSGNCGELLTASSHAIFAAHMHAHTHTHTHTHFWSPYMRTVHRKLSLKSRRQNEGQGVFPQWHDISFSLRFICVRCKNPKPLRPQTQTALVHSQEQILCSSNATTRLKPQSTSYHNHDLKENQAQTKC